MKFEAAHVRMANLGDCTLPRAKAGPRAISDLAQPSVVLGCQGLQPMQCTTHRTTGCIEWKCLFLGHGRPSGAVQ